VYCANNPLIYTDPSGLMLPAQGIHFPRALGNLFEFEGHLNEDDIFNFFQIFREALKYGSFATNINLMMGAMDYRINVDKAFVDGDRGIYNQNYNNNFDYETKRVNFNIYGLLLYPGGRIMDPISLLNHEVGHAADSILNPMLWANEQRSIQTFDRMRQANSRGLFDALWRGTREVVEMRNITLYETPFNIERGVVTRNIYYGDGSTNVNMYTNAIPYLINLPGYEFLRY